MSRAAALQYQVADDALQYEVVENWEKLPHGYKHRDVSGVAVDSKDRAFLICRGDHPVIIFDRHGNFVDSWGEGEFTYRTHGITIGPDDSVFLTDDGNHTVRKFTPDGKLLMTLGTMNAPSDTGYNGSDYGVVERPGGPFNRPTNLAIAKNGDLYVSDGYGNCRVHQFSPAGELIRSWGAPGSGPGEFILVHGIGIAPDGRVFVCDRENDRIQIFSPEGEYIAEWEAQRPEHLVFDKKGRVYVAELSWHPGMTSPRRGEIQDVEPARVSILDPEGNVLARWGGLDPSAAGSFAAPHGIALDSQGDLYVSEVTWTYAVRRGLAPPDCHTFQKFVLRS
jgi:streptogramin lyase